MGPPLRPAAPATPPEARRSRPSEPVEATPADVPGEAVERTRAQRNPLDDLFVDREEPVVRRESKPKKAPKAKAEPKPERESKPKPEPKSEPQPRAASRTAVGRRRRSVEAGPHAAPPQAQADADAAAVGGALRHVTRARDAGQARGPAAAR